MLPAQTDIENPLDIGFRQRRRQEIVRTFRAESQRQAFEFGEYARVDRHPSRRVGADRQLGADPNIARSKT